MRARSDSKAGCEKILKSQAVLELDALSNADKTFLIEAILSWLHLKQMLEPGREQFKSSTPWLSRRPTTSSSSGPRLSDGRSEGEKCCLAGLFRLFAFKRALLDFGTAGAVSSWCDHRDRSLQLLQTNMVQDILQQLQKWTNAVLIGPKQENACVRARRVDSDVPEALVRRDQEPAFALNSLP